MSQAPFQRYSADRCRAAGHQLVSRAVGARCVPFHFPNASGYPGELPRHGCGTTATNGTPAPAPATLDAPAPKSANRGRSNPRDGNRAASCPGLLPKPLKAARCQGQHGPPPPRLQQRLPYVSKRCFPPRSWTYGGSWHCGASTKRCLLALSVRPGHLLLQLHCGHLKPVLQIRAHGAVQSAGDHGLPQACQGLLRVHPAVAQGRAMVVPDLPCLSDAATSWPARMHHNPQQKIWAEHRTCKMNLGRVVLFVYVWQTPRKNKHKHKLARGAP